MLQRPVDFPLNRFLRIISKTVLLILFLVIAVAVALRISAALRESSTASVLAPTNGQFVSTSEGVLHVSIWGAENKTTVLFTHGMAAWGGLWTETAEELSNNGYRVIAIDQPPFGFSDRSDHDFSRSRQAARLNALASRMKLKDYLLVGHSYGGGVALETALRHPANISGLVLICPVINLAKDVAPSQPIVPGKTPLPLRSTVLAETLVSASVTNPWLTGFLTKRFMHRKEALTDEHIAILQKPMALQGNTRFMVKWLTQFLAGDPKAISRRASEIAELKLPVSFIWGDKDAVTPIEQGFELAKIIKPVKLHSLTDVGHMPQLEVPKLFNKTLIKTLDELRAIDAPR